MSSQPEETSSRFSTPIYFPPAPYDPGSAKLCLALVNAAYDMYLQWKKQDEPKEADFQWKPAAPPGTDFQYSRPIWGTDTVLWYFKYPEPVAFVAWNDGGDVHLAFRGTESKADWAENADTDQVPYTLAPGYGQVHHGFNSIYESMSQTIAAALAAVENPRRLFISGHSLGASLSILAVPDIITNTAYKPDRLPVFNYNFASPRTGDPVFTTRYNKNGAPTWRVVNISDFVPCVPPSILGHLIFEHVGIQVSFTAQYDSLAGNHSSTNSYGYALNHPEQPQGPVPSDT